MNYVCEQGINNVNYANNASGAGLFAMLKTPRGVFLVIFWQRGSAGASDVTNVSVSQNDCRCCNIGNIKYEKTSTEQIYKRAHNINIWANAIS